jgi:hypothetical protein
MAEWKESAELVNADVETRYQYWLKEVVAARQIWILTDSDGCVMLNTEEEDLVPVWPSEESAKAWATGDWSECEPLSISLAKWHSRWTYGLEDDDLAVVVYPNTDMEGLVIDPKELDQELLTKERKLIKR